jgi:dolichyl-phosphate beta-glucosyltransferase
MMDKLISNRVFLTVLIPCYNEAENLKRGVLKEVYDYLKTKKFSWEVIVSDDGSTDRSREIVKERIAALKGFRLLRNPHGGKPSTLNYGIKSAKGKYILFTDMDQSTPITELDKLLLFVKKGYKAVVGSRGLTRKKFPLYRKFGAYIFSTFRRAMILPHIADTQCGFKLFETELLRSVFPKLEFFKKKQEVKGWKVTSFDVELYHLIEKKGEKIKEVVVDWQDRDISKTKGGSLQKYIKESKEMFMQVLRVKLNDLRGLYD